MYILITFLIFLINYFGVLLIRSALSPIEDLSVILLDVPQRRGRRANIQLCDITPPPNFSTNVNIWDH
jgi:hypothetical protein